MGFSGGSRSSLASWRRAQTLQHARYRACKGGLYAARPRRAWCTAMPQQSQVTIWSKSKSESMSHTQQRSPLYRTLSGW